jgi:hypothetical protein
VKIEKLKVSTKKIVRNKGEQNFEIQNQLHFHINGNCTQKTKFKKQQFILNGLKNTIHLTTSPVRHEQIFTRENYKAALTYIKELNK